ncbi:hypothetical protein [Methanocella sp. MCL-LM]|uniref:hypothetical protein n=1 Tax=Methanocella sp. MCL-LM TaxID=3412035 RepID=UPI003C7183E1
MSYSPAKNLQMGYCCPKCDEQRTNRWELPTRRTPLYERDSKGFHYAGYIKCPEHGIQPGQPMQGTSTLKNIYQEKGPAERRAQNQPVQEARAQTPAPGPAAAASPKPAAPAPNNECIRTKIANTIWEMPENIYDLIAQELASGADHSHQDPRNWQRSDVYTTIEKDGHGEFEMLVCKICRARYKRRPWAWQPPQAPQKKAESVHTPVVDADAQPQARPQLKPQLSRKSLASMAAKEHKLAKAASSRIYHAVQIDDQVLYKGSTGSIYKWAIVGKQPDGAWRFYAGAEDHIQAGEECDKLRARSDKQKLDMEIRIIAAVSEKEA